MPDCDFCAIVDGTAPAGVVARDADTVVFLDKTPLFPGHCLIVPVRHVPTLADLTDTEMLPLMRWVRHASDRIPKALGAEGTFVAANNVVSQSVPHLHFHVVPRRRKDGLRGFFWPRRGYDDDAHFHATLDRISAALAGGPNRLD
jgi:histidine triad (HIT) family protein